MSGDAMRAARTANSAVYALARAETDRESCGRITRAVSQIVGHVPAHGSDETPAERRRADVDLGRRITELPADERAELLRSKLFDTIPKFLPRELTALGNFLAQHPADRFARGNVVTLMLRMAAVMFAAGFMDPGESGMNMAGDARVALYVAGMGLHPMASEMVALLGDTGFSLEIWLGTWFRSGCPRVRLTREEASALALTDLPAGFNSEEPPPAPWESFLIEIPEGVLLLDDGGDTPLEVDRIMMGHLYAAPGMRGLWFTMLGCGEEVISMPSVQSKDMDRARVIAQRRSGKPFSPGIDRGLGAATRIAAGVCFALENKRADGKLRVRSAPPSRVGGPPQTTDIRLGLPVKLDFTEPLNDFTLGRRYAAPKSQWAVRGHWRNLLNGKPPRKTWVHPYMKGPAHLPVLVRAHHLGESKP